MFSLHFLRFKNVFSFPFLSAFLLFTCPLDFTVTIYPCGKCFRLLSEPTLLERAPVDSTRGYHLAWRASSIKKENIGMDSAAIKDNSIVDIHQRATREFVFPCFASVV